MCPIMAKCLDVRRDVYVIQNKLLEGKYTLLVRVSRKPVHCSTQKIQLEAQN